MAEIPDKVQEEKRDWISIGVGVLVLIISFLAYWGTVQRTLSFWDCGEFIACSYILGIPHPPGSPLYILFGRIFSIIPMASDVGFRVNMFTVFCTAFAAMFGYFIVVKFVRDFMAESWTWVQRTGTYAAGFIGGLLMAFSFTNWNSAVEAEVYGASMLLITLIIWVALVWADKRESPGADKYLVLIAYLSTLSFAVHQTVYLIVPMILLLAILVDERIRHDWRFWVSSVVLTTLAVSLDMYMTFVVIWFVVTMVAFFVTRHRSWALAFFMMLAVLGGFSVQTYTPIRAALKPAINENNPDNWAQFKSFLERKQYGQQSMISRVFTRRGTWGNQFGTHSRMGFWGFFWEQYGVVGRPFIFTLFPLGLIGLGELMHRRWKKGVPFFLMVLAATVGLVIYMNFADGTMQGLLGADDAHLEVRDRDYFWQPGFILFGLAIGVGFAALWDMFYTGMRRKRNVLLGVLAIWLVIGLYPVKEAFSKNYARIDRSNNFIPYDYAYNLLTSADSNAVVFTNGDNDTFPVWCLQEAYGIRKDVRIANLSLLNTNWYIKQLKNQMGVPINMTDAQIDELGYARYADGKLARPQDQMIDDIIVTNRWQVPVEFAVTCSDENRVFRGQSVDNHLEINGMMYRLTRESGQDMIDIEGTKDLYVNKFRYRGVSDSTVPKDENTERLTNNYGAGFLYCADRMRRKGDVASAIEMVDKATEVLPHQWQLYGFLAQMYSDLDSLNRVDDILKKAPPDVDLSQVWATLAHTYWSRGDKPRAYTILRTELAKNPANKTAYSQMVTYLYRDSLYDSLATLIEHWLVDNPSDTEASQALEEVKRMAGMDTTKQSVKVKQIDTVRGDQSGQTE